MAKNSKPKAPAKKAKTLAGRRRTRMIALEPRMLFDGALGIDLSAKATAALQGDSTEHADTATPAAPEAQRTDAQKAVEKPAEKTNEKALDKQIESLEARPGAEPKELVFVDARVENAQELLKNIDPNAKVVM